MLDKETASNAPAVAEIIAIPVKQKNSQVNRLVPAFFGGSLRVGPALLLMGRTVPACPVLRLAAFFLWSDSLDGCLDEIGPFLTVLTQFPHHTMTQTTNFTDQITQSQITEANLKLLNINSIFADCLQNHSLFSACFLYGTMYLAIGFGIDLEIDLRGITAGILNTVID